VAIITFTLTVWSNHPSDTRYIQLYYAAQIFFGWKQASTSAQTDPGSDSASWMHVNAEIEKDAQDNTS
jgi:hypothetical protein